ncbi:MAG: TIGR02996 domain-containing protein [Archangiaceae bacterium]|nr:TIGR02996 domain-containing protein [Archangiaceae bacterium]
MALDLPLKQTERVAALARASLDPQTRSEAIRETLAWFPSVQPHVLCPVVEAWAKLPSEPMVGDAVFELMRVPQLSASLRKVLFAALEVHHHPRLGAELARWIAKHGVEGWPSGLKRFGGVSHLLHPNADRPAVRAREPAPDKSEDEFIDAIVSNPDDDSVRHVFADWLSERGRVQGEFISLQLKAATTKLSATEKAREKQLLVAHLAELLGPFAGHAQSSGLRFSRGFVSAMRPKHVPHHPLTRLIKKLNALVWLPRDPTPVAFDSLEVVERLPKRSLLVVTTLAPRLKDLELDGYDPSQAWEQDLASVKRSVATLRLTRFLNLREALGQLAKSRLMEACSTLHLADFNEQPDVVELIPSSVTTVIAEHDGETHHLRG